MIRLMARVKELTVTKKNVKQIYADEGCETSSARDVGESRKGDSACQGVGRRIHPCEHARSAGRSAAQRHERRPPFCGSRFRKGHPDYGQAGPSSDTLLCLPREQTIALL